MTHGGGLLSVAYRNLVGVLIEAVKDLADKIDRFEGSNIIGRDWALL